VGAVVMLGTLFGLIIVFYTLVYVLDPEARNPKDAKDGSR
jgi:hypothetical protein